MSAAAPAAVAAAAPVAADPSPAVPFAPSSSVPFTQLVSFIAKDADAANHIVDLWRFATDYTVQKEKGLTTLTYEIYRPTAMPDAQPRMTEVCALETYASKLQLDTVHMKAREISEFISSASAQISEPMGIRYLYAAEGFHSRGEAREAEVRASGVKPHMLVATMDFHTPAAAARFLAGLARDIAATVKAEEPGCISYHWYLSTSDPEQNPTTATQILIYERYLQISDLTDTHVNAPYFKEFVAAISALPKEDQPIGGVLHLRHYNELAIGFVGDA